MRISDWSSDVCSSDLWRIGGELIASDEADAFSNGNRRTFLIGAIPLSLTYDGSDDLLNPSRGFRLGGRGRPELSFQNSTFGRSGERRGGKGGVRSVNLPGATVHSKQKTKYSTT